MKSQYHWIYGSGASNIQRHRKRTLSLESPSSRSKTIEGGSIYRTLSKKNHEIRLFRFEKTGSQCPSAWLRLSLRTFRYSEEHVVPYPRFFAVSYSWDAPEGSPSPEDQTVKRPILINGRVHEVRINLYNGLYALRKRMDAQWIDDVWFWVDAICINQEDDMEKGWQVDYMTVIYRRALAVIVWLGAAETLRIHEVREILLRLRNLTKSIRAEAALCNKDPLDYWEENVDGYKRFKEANLPTSFHPCWQQLCAFLSRRWWSRVWAIQEVAATREILFYCGDAVLLEEDFSDLDISIEICETFNRLNQHHFWSKDEVITRPGLAVRHLLQIRCVSRINRYSTGSDYRALIQGSTLKFSPAAFLLYLLDESAGHQATDPRDHVFGLLGLCRASDVGDQVTLHANYKNTTPKSVFTETTKYIISSTAWLGALTLKQRGCHEKTTGLPSYVPDFASLSRVGFAADKFSDLLPTLLALAETAPRHGQPDFQGDLLDVYGIQIGSVEEVSESRSDFHQELFSFSHGARILANCDDIYPYTVNQSRFEAFWRTLMEDDLTIGERPMGESFCYYWAKRLLDFLYSNSHTFRTPDEDGEAGPHQSYPTNSKGLIESFLSKNPAYRTVLASCELMAGLFSKIEDTISKHDPDTDYRTTPFYTSLLSQSKLFSNWFMWKNIHRCLCRTSKNHLGTVNPDTQIGDEVWILARSPWPFVLRKTNGQETRRLISPAYIHGFNTHNGGRILTSVLEQSEGEEQPWRNVLIQ